MTEAMTELLNSLTSLLWEQQEYLKEAMDLLQEMSLDTQRLIEQAGADETRIRQLQAQIWEWKTLCSELTEQNEALTRQNQKLLELKGPLMREERSGAGMSSFYRRDISGREEADWRSMSRENLLEALTAARQKTRNTYEQMISLRRLIARLNEENEMLLTLWEETEKKFRSAKNAYDKLWSSYEQYKGLYETVRRKNLGLQKDAGLRSKYVKKCIWHRTGKQKTIAEMYSGQTRRVCS